MKQIETDRKIAMSHELNKQRLTVLTAQDRALERVIEASRERLSQASKDSTVKMWRVSDRKAGGKAVKAQSTLPGHADEVYALDWSPNGARVASGSKDRTIKIWIS